MNNVENNNRLSADFSAFMQRLASGQGVDGEVSIKSEKTDNGVTLTVTRTGSGDPVVKTYEVPELSEATLQDKFPVMASLKSLAGKVPPETFQKLQDALGAFGRELRKACSSSGTPQTNDAHRQTMFDIYDLLRLLQDVGQTLKNTARESREAALQSDMALIRSEASIQKQAAIDGLITTVAISVGMCLFTSVLGGLSIRSSTKAYNISKGTPKPNVAAAEAQAASKEAAVKKDEKVNKTEKEEEARSSKAQQEKSANASGKSSKTQSKDNAEKVQEKRENDIKDKEEDEQIIEEQGNAKKTEQNLKAEKNEVKDKGLEDKKEAKVDKEKAADEKKDEELAEDDEPKLSRAERDAMQKAQTKSQKYMTASQAFMMLGQGLGGLGQSVQQIESAAGTMLEADQRKAEALRDELTEIMQDAQAVISAVKDLRESIIQSESQSIDTILRA